MKKRAFTILLTVCLTTSVCGAQGLSAVRDTSTVWSLDECMSYAVTNSPSAVRALLQNANLKMSHTEAILDYLPSLSGGVSASSNFGRSINPADNSYTDVATFNNGYSINASIPVFSGLAVTNGVRQAKVARLRGEQELKQVRDQIAIKTMDAYYAYAYAMGLATLAERQVDEWRMVLKLSQSQYAQGLTSASALAEVEADLASYEYNLISAQNTLRTRELALKNQMNYPTGTSLKIDTTQGMPVLEAQESVEDLIAGASKILPQSLMSKMDVRSGELSLSSSRASLFPSVSLSGGIGTSFYTTLNTGGPSRTFSEQMRNNLSENVGISIGVPIFGGWSRQFNVRKVHNNLRKLQQFDIETQRQIAAEVEQAVLDLNGAFYEEAQAEKRTRATELAYRAAQRRYAEGLLSAIDLQTTANKLLSARATLLNARLTWQAKRRLVDYYKGVPLIDEARLGAD